MTLDKLGIGHAAVIVKIKGKSAFCRRLLEMGFTPGTKIAVTGTAPLGDPIEMCLRGYKIAIRRTDAQNIEVAGYLAQNMRLIY